MSQLRLLCVAFVFCLAVCSHSWAETPSNGFAVARQVEFNSIRNSRFTVDLGVLPTASTGKITITLRNSTRQIRRFTNVRTTCACISANISQKSIEPGKAALVTLELNTKSTSNKPSAALVVRVEGDAPHSKSIDFVLKYRLAGLLVFKSELNSHLVSNGPQFATVRVPFYATSPVDAAACGVSMQKDVLGNTQIEQDPADPTSWFLVVSFRVADVPAAGFASWMRLEDPNSDAKAQAVLVLTSRTPIRVSPRSIRFVRDDANPEKLVANCIIDVDKEGVTQQVPRRSLQKASNKIVVTARMAGKALKARTTHMGTNYYRCRLSCPVEFMDYAIKQQKEEDGPLEVNWEIAANGTKAVLQSRVSVTRSLVVAPVF